MVVDVVYGMRYTIKFGLFNLQEPFNSNMSLLKHHKALFYEHGEVL